MIKILFHEFGLQKRENVEKSKSKLVNYDRFSYWRI